MSIFEKISQKTRMLIEFTVGNYLSFKDKKTLALQATGIKEYTDTNLITTDRVTLLKSAVLYGANSSGKSNLLKAMSIMRRLVLESFEQSSASQLDIIPFLLSTETEQQPSFFEVVFLINNIRYRYGFEVDHSTVHSEWLYESKKHLEKPLFIRERSGIEVMTKSFPEGKDLEERTRDNALFLAVVDQFNGEIAKRIMHWFSDFAVISGLIDIGYSNITYEMIEHEKSYRTLLKFYEQLDLGFDDVKIGRYSIEDKDFDDNHYRGVIEIEGNSLITIRTSHKKYDIKNRSKGKVEFDMQTQESSGTNKLFKISGPVFDTLLNGGVLVIDELDASLHPLLTIAIIKLFNSSESNQHNAQLIFATHDTNLLTYGNYRRDQIYFVEKDNFGASDLYSLVEYKEEGSAKTIRKDRSFEKDYIQGRYGAIPFIGNLSNIVKEWQEK
jgi:AAA15 family ATPase/GTPase